MSELVIAAATAFFGVLVYVIGQTLQRFILEPVQDLRRLKGEIAFALVYYANKAFPLASEEAEIVDEASDKIRKLASDLRRALEVVPFYGLLSFFRLVPKRKAILIASSGLIGWSNSLRSGVHSPHRDEIKQALKIDWD